MARPRGVPNKPRTLLNRELEKMGIKPLEYIHAALNDPEVSSVEKSKMMLKLLHFIHPTLRSAEVKTSANATLKASFVDDTMNEAWSQKPTDPEGDGNPTS